MVDAKNESRIISAEKSKQILLRGSVPRTFVKAALILLVCLGLTAGTVWAATFTATLEGSFPIQITQGQTINNAFAVRLSTSGAFKNHTGNVVVCNSVTLHADGTFTCNSETTISIQPSTGAPPQIPGFPQDVQISVIADADVLCNQTYRISVTARLDIDGGANFGQDANGHDILQVTLPFDVQVACANSIREGCSHGYWKNHLASWVTLQPTDTVGSVFDSAISYGIGDDTLLQALNYTGGSTLTAAAKLLLLQAVAAILNADNPLVAFERTADEIIFDVNAALDSSNRSTILSLAAALDGDNNLGCPLN
jgi:hypothetical protein